MLAYAYNIIVDCDVVVYVLNTAYKRFLSILISNMQVPGSRGYDNLMAIHTSTNREEVSIARQCQEHLSETTRKNGVIDQGNYIKQESKHKWNYSKYCVKKTYDVTHRSVKMSCDTTQFPVFPFGGPHTKSHVMWGLINHYYLLLDAKIGHENVQY